jgi:hypothetical protein
MSAKLQDMGYNKRGKEWHLLDGSSLVRHYEDFTLATKTQAQT